ncbi:hypothetical protein FGG08_003738 [Glutinoglossum americanum]|uniref:Uncharacterized protein n=1 Tax=Glutinoglossum americanum TaxID=1670608 RepID=A0A9P8I3N7_9PEZI|nr:hypothetical protein FGG08_003738 [Glutinoglossum americanum]
MVQFEDYNVQSHYNSLLDLEDASNDFNARQASSVVDTLIRDLFLRRGVQDTLGLTLLHKHFPLDDNTKMVNYGAVAYPWDMADASSEVVRDIYPTAWRFTDTGGIAPYEFGYTQGGAETPGVRKEESAEFLQELQELLQKHNLTSLLGLRLLDAATSEPGVEFTSGSANITLPREVFANNQGRHVEALWVFQKALEGSSGDPLVYKVCKSYCFKDNKGKHVKKHHRTF